MELERWKLDMLNIIKNIELKSLLSVSDFFKLSNKTIGQRRPVPLILYKEI